MNPIAQNIPVVYLHLEGTSNRLDIVLSSFFGLAVSHIQRIGCHEEVLYLQPMIPPKGFDVFPPGWGMLRRSRCVQIFL